MRVERASVGRLARFGIATQVAVTAVLALAAVVMINWLAGRPGIRVRLDLTAKGRNTLSAAALGVVRGLQEDVTIDIFYRPEPLPLTQLAHEVMQQTDHFLGLMKQEAGGRIEVRQNDTRDKAAIDQRLRELKIRGYENCLVVSSGPNRAVVRLRGGLADFDFGRPDPKAYIPPRIAQLKAEEGIVEGILDATKGEVKRLYFSFGQDERDVDDTDDANALGRLKVELVDDGFEVERWNPQEDGPVPEDCAALAIVGPAAAFSDEALESIRRYVDGGGRLVIAPHPFPREMVLSRVPELLDGYGIGVSEGLVMRGFPDGTGRVLYGDPQNTGFRINADRMSVHDITTPLREGGRWIAINGAHRMYYKRQPTMGQTVKLFESPPDCWIDEPPIDFKPDPLREPDRRAYELAVTSIVVLDPSGDTPELEVNPEARIVAVGSADLFCNHLIQFNVDLLRNIFNWATSREFRVNISPRDPGIQRIEDTSGVNRVAMAWIPGLCLLLGVVTAVLRARGGPRRSAA